MSQSDWKDAYQKQRHELLAAYERIADLEQEVNIVKRQVSVRYYNETIICDVRHNDTDMGVNAVTFFFAGGSNPGTANERDGGEKGCCYWILQTRVREKSFQSCHWEDGCGSRRKRGLRLHWLKRDWYYPCFTSCTDSQGLLLNILSIKYMLGLKTYEVSLSASNMNTVQLAPPCSGSFLMDHPYWKRYVWLSQEIIVAYLTSFNILTV